MTCPDCGDSGRVCITVVCVEKRLELQGRALVTVERPAARYEAARCDCRAGDEYRTYLTRGDLVQAMRGREGLSRHPTAIDVVELNRPTGERYAIALGEVWTGGAVTHEHRQHAWRAARAPVQVVVGGITLDAGPEPVRYDRPARGTWHDRPDADSYDTETQGAWA